MTGHIDDPAELHDLLNALCDESITAEQLRRLEELVLASPEAEAFFVQYMSLHADLVSHFDVLPARTPAESQEPRDESQTPPALGSRLSARGSPRRRWRRALGLLALAAALLLAVALWPRPADEPPTSEPFDDSVAVLLQAPAAEWENAGRPLRAGAALHPGWLRLKSGFAQIEFYNGAVVILEGPAELQLLSRTQAYCARGKLRATVPPQAQGFTIGSPGLDLIDRGTEFGLAVGAGERTEVHVFQGKVELYDRGSGRPVAPRKEVTTGQGVCLEAPGTVRPIKLNPKAFLTAEELGARAEAERRRRQQEWAAASEALRRDPSLLVYYTFEAGQPWSRTLPDRGRGGRDGAVVGCSWVAGRWPGKQGLEFKRVSDRVRFHVPGEFDSLTLMAWVRVDGLPNVNNSLMMADGWGEGGVHWQVGRTGTIILGIQSRPKGRGAHYHAAEALTPQRFGQWVHLAVVYDRDAGVVTHYLDGRPAAEVPVAFDLPLRVGDAEIGNWNIASHRNRSPVRYFSGCMDEFLLFARALSGREVERQYALGRP
jgi:hypothetical protein